MSVWAKLALGALGVLAAVGLVLGAVGEANSGGDRSAGGSAADRGPDGLLAYSELLGAAGHEVRRVDAAPAEADLDPAETAVLVDPGELTATDAGDLREFVEDGGVLIVGGEAEAEAIERITGSALELDGGVAPASLSPLVPAPELAGVGEVSADGAPAISDAGALLPLLGAPGAYTALAAARGEGRLIFLADASPLRNRRITDADNARLGLALAGAPTRPVAFIERVSAAPASGLGALPERWWWVLAGLIAAGVALIAARGRRLGPPHAPPRSAQPPRLRYVDAIATSLARAADPGGATEPLRRAARDALSRRAGLRAEADGEELRRAAASLGLDEREAELLARPATDEGEAVALARAMAKLRT